MENRIALQNQIKKDALEVFNSKDSSILFSEIKTGTGKTKILLDTAFERLKQTRKSVIISTSNNFLTLEYIKEAKKFGYDIDKLAIFVGKDNYVNPETILDEIFLKEFNIQKEDVENWLKKNANYPLINLFVEDFALTEDAAIIASEAREEDLTISDKTDIIAETPMIYITNHYYLMFLLNFAKAEDFFDVDMYLDEVHLLNQAAKNLYKKSFSPFRLIFLLRRILKESKKQKKEYVHLLYETDNLLSYCKRYAKRKFNKAIENVIVNRLKAYIDSDIYKNAKTALLKASKKQTNDTIRSCLRELYEAVFVVRGKNIEISFSPVKTNVTFATSEDNPINRLKALLSKHTGNFWGVSGTLRAAVDNSFADNSWAFERIGFYKYSEPQYEKDFNFNYRLLNITFKVYDSVFKKEQLGFYIAEDKRYLPVKDLKSEKFEESYQEWINNLADLAKDTFYHSGLILMSSYENVAMMKEALEKNDFTAKYKVFAYTMGTNMRKVVKEYKDSVDNGHLSVLIGGLNFYTGIDLPGDYLKTLFIGKLPLEARGDFFSRKKFGNYSSHADMRKNALLTFRQGIGRAIRSEKDRSLIVVADPRINTTRYKIFKEFLEEIGIDAQRALQK